MKINELRNLNDIPRVEKRGLYKRSLCKSIGDSLIVDDCLQKINYCIQDLNQELTCMDDLSIKSIVYIITLAAWISEAMPNLRGRYLDVVMNGFHYSREGELIQACNYLKALRSFAVAHPLETDRHPAYGMDGSLICIDIVLPHKSLSLHPDEHFRTLNHTGLHKEKTQEADFYLQAYSREIEHEVHPVFIGCTLSDIYHVAELYIDKLYALDQYLRKMTKDGREVKA